MLGRTIGNYEVISQFGEGGMGELYLGRHTKLAREVIIKTIRTEDFSPRQIEHLRVRLEREAYIQSQLDHPNIVRVYDFLATGEKTCMVLEYVPGRDLRRMIARETGPLAPARAVRLFKQVLHAIDYAHHFIYTDKSGQRHQGIIHRDLKPANILVTPNDIAKVTDFGIVKVRGVKGGTQMGFNPGTPEYMSPEQARGRELDHRSDIYSLGIVFYEMLTGNVPFSDDGGNSSDYEIRRGHIELPPPSLIKFKPDLSPELEKIVLKALEKDPGERYQTARDFLLVLDDYELTGRARFTGRLPGQRQTLMQDERGTGPGDLSTTTTVGFGDTAGTVSQQGGLATINNGQYYQPDLPNRLIDDYPRPLLPVTPPPRKAQWPLIIGTAALVLLTLGVIWWIIKNSQNTVSGPPATPTPPAVAVPPGMVSIPTGDFLMGRDDGNPFEKPAHKVTVGAFFIDQYEVTNEQYAEFVRTLRRNPPSHWREGIYEPGDAPLPVVNVSWYDARDYCEWAGKRLPTEEEWEYAARGRENRLYPYGNQWDPRFSSARETGQSKPQAVGSYPEGVSPFGVFDMAGNVAEWTASEYQPYPGSTAKTDPNNRVIRGGGFKVPAKEQTSTDRFFDLQGRSFDFIGFRCAKDAK